MWKCKLGWHTWDKWKEVVRNYKEYRYSSGIITSETEPNEVLFQTRSCSVCGFIQEQKL